MTKVFRVAAYEPRAMFEPKSTALYAIIAFELVLNVILYSALGLHIVGIPFGAPIAAAVAVMGSAYAARRIGMARIATWLEASALIYIHGATCWALFFPATVFALPYGDWWLSAADKAIGFDFPAVWRASEPHMRLLQLVYRTFSFQAALAIPLLVYFKRDPWPLATALGIALLITLLIYPFATAVGPISYYGLGPKGSWTPMIEALRDHGVRQIQPNMLVGMVSLPSYHVAGAVLVIKATWPLRVLRWPFLIVNIGLIFSTIPYGQHYLVDVIGGALVAAAAATLAKAWFQLQDGWEPFPPDIQPKIA